MDSVLAHYGIPGMKWGVRRYQKKNGAFTAEGKARVKQIVGEMSDNDLRNAVDRIRLEQQYRQMLDKEVVTGKSTVEKLLATGTALAAASTTAIALYKNFGTIKELLSKSAKKADPA